MINVITSIVIIVCAVLRFVIVKALKTFVITGLSLLGLRRPSGKLCRVHSGARVAVLGGGIAGTAAAWSLAKSNVCDVYLIEPRTSLGGNAKTFAWPVGDNDAAGPYRSVTTGLSVLAWPRKYFKHYEMLLRKLGVDVQSVVPKFFVSVDGKTPTFRQGAENVQWDADQRRWDDAIAFVRRVNNVFKSASDLASILSHGISWMFRKFISIVFPFSAFEKGHRSRAVPKSCSPSLYDVVYFNPMNVIPARPFCRYVFGVSDEFWEQVVVPVYSSSFLTCELNQTPCVILPTLDDIISVGSKDPLKPLNTWKHTSREVFEKLAADIVNGPETPPHEGKASWVRREHRVFLNTSVTECQYSLSKNNWSLQLVQNDKPNDVFKLTFDWVVFACPATAVDALTNSESNRESGFRSSVFESIIPNVLYENQRDNNFMSGDIHSVRDVLPSPFRSELIMNRYSNYVQIIGDPKAGSVENTFILGTWVPEATRDFADLTAKSPIVASSEPAQKGNKSGQAAAPQQRTEKNAPIKLDAHDMYVTYNPSSDATRDVIAGKSLGRVDNCWAHPQFTIASMGLSMVMPLLQGQCNANYCASYTTPGNGHDLSMLSGLAVAHYISGYYPFGKEAGDAERKDFAQLRSMMFW